MEHLPLVALEAGLEEIRASPRDQGRIELIVARPGAAERSVLDSGMLDDQIGLVGDNWSTRERDPDPRTMLTLINARLAALVAGAPERRQLAGDQLFVDFDLARANLPPGSRLAVGDAVIEVTDVPHTGCGKFVARFGVAAQKFINSPVGRELNLRGINARVIAGGRVRVGDAIAKLAVV
jgi:MOSC domain-containing protein YiiM